MTDPVIGVHCSHGWRVADYGCSNQLRERLSYLDSGNDLSNHDAKFPHLLFEESRAGERA